MVLVAVALAQLANKLVLNIFKWNLILFSGILFFIFVLITIHPFLVKDNPADVEILIVKDISIGRASFDYLDNGNNDTL